MRPLPILKEDLLQAHMETQACRVQRLRIEAQKIRGTRATLEREQKGDYDGARQIT